MFAIIAVLLVIFASSCALCLPKLPFVNFQSFQTALKKSPLENQLQPKSVCASLAPSAHSRSLVYTKYGIDFPLLPSLSYPIGLLDSTHLHMLEYADYETVEYVSKALLKLCGQCKVKVQLLEDLQLCKAHPMHALAALNNVGIGDIDTTTPEVSFEGYDDQVLRIGGALISLTDLQFYCRLFNDIMRCVAAEQAEDKNTLAEIETAYASEVTSYRNYVETIARRMEAKKEKFREMHNPQ